MTMDTANTVTTNKFVKSMCSILIVNEMVYVFYIIMTALSILSWNAREIISLSLGITTFTLSEAILFAFELHSTIFAAFLDIMRDFDSIWHAGLIKILKLLGIKGPILRIIDQWYTEECNFLKWRNIIMVSS
jgi:hypothetical protein